MCTNIGRIDYVGHHITTSPQTRKTTHWCTFPFLPFSSCTALTDFKGLWLKQRVWRKEDSFSGEVNQKSYFGGHTSLGVL